MILLMIIGVSMIHKIVTSIMHMRAFSCFKNSGPTICPSIFRGFIDIVIRPSGSLSFGELFGSSLAFPTFWFLAISPGRILISSLILIGFDSGVGLTESQKESSSMNSRSSSGPFYFLTSDFK